MPRTQPQFPAFDDWQNMNESDQDALIARIEAAQRREALGGRLRVVVAAVTLAVIACAGAYFALG